MSNKEKEWLKKEQEERAKAFLHLIRVSKDPTNAGYTTIKDLIMLVQELDKKIYEKIGDCPEN
jgi:hypothetical protein